MDAQEGRLAEVGYWFGFLSELTCPIPSPFEHGFTVGEVYSVGYALNYVCHFGYRLVGNASRLCLPSRQWSAPAPSCEGKEQFVLLEYVLHPNEHLCES